MAELTFKDFSAKIGLSSELKAQSSGFFKFAPVAQLDPALSRYARSARIVERPGFSLCTFFFNHQLF